MIERLAEDGKKQFKDIDIDKNGFLNLLELQKADFKFKNNESAAFLAKNYDQIISFEDDNIYVGKRADSNRNNYGLSIEDINTLSMLSAGKKEELIRAAGRNGAAHGAAIGGLGGIVGFGFSALTETVGPLPAIILIGAPIAGSIAGYAIERYRGRARYDAKEQQVKTIMMNTPAYERG